jgi:hypothetical protein
MGFREGEELSFFLEEVGLFFVFPYAFFLLVAYTTVNDAYISDMHALLAFFWYLNVDSLF